MSVVVDRETEVLLDYDGEASRYAIYSVADREPPPAGSVMGDWSPRAHEGYVLTADDRRGSRRRIAETSLDGIGMTLSTLRAEDELTDDSRVGILDRLDRIWLVNPWARGDLR